MLDVFIGDTGHEFPEPENISQEQLFGVCEKIANWREGQLSIAAEELINLLKTDSPQLIIKAFEKAFIDLGYTWGSSSGNLGVADVEDFLKEEYRFHLDLFAAFYRNVAEKHLPVEYHPDFIAWLNDIIHSLNLTKQQILNISDQLGVKITADYSKCWQVVGTESVGLPEKLHFPIGGARFAYPAILSILNQAAALQKQGLLNEKMLESVKRIVSSSLLPAVYPPIPWTPETRAEYAEKLTHLKQINKLHSEIESLHFKQTKSYLKRKDRAYILRLLASLRDGVTTTPRDPSGSGSLIKKIDALKSEIEEMTETDNVSDNVIAKILKIVGSFWRYKDSQLSDLDKQQLKNMDLTVLLERSPQALEDLENMEKSQDVKPEKFIKILGYDRVSSEKYIAPSRYYNLEASLRKQLNEDYRPNPQYQQHRLEPFIGLEAGFPQTQREVGTLQFLKQILEKISNSDQETHLKVPEYNPLMHHVSIFEASSLVPSSRLIIDDSFGGHESAMASWVNVVNNMVRQEDTVFYMPEVISAYGLQLTIPGHTQIYLVLVDEDMVSRLPNDIDPNKSEAMDISHTRQSIKGIEIRFAYIRSADNKVILLQPKAEIKPELRLVAEPKQPTTVGRLSTEVEYG